MRAALAVACVLACGKSEAPAPAPAPAPAGSAQVPAPAPSNPRCEQLRDKYLAWSSDRMRDAIREAPADQQRELQAEADKELARAKDNFVEACVAMGSDLDPGCFDKAQERERRCAGMLKDLQARLLAPRH